MSPEISAGNPEAPSASKDLEASKASEKAKAIVGF